MIPFSVGDLVVSIVNHPEGNLDIYIGTTGTVVDIDLGLRIVKVHWDFERPSQQAHSCGGRCPDGYGWNVHFNTIKLCDKDFGQFDASESSDVDAFLFGGVEGV